MQVLKEKQFVRLASANRHFQTAIYNSRFLVFIRLNLNQTGLSGTADVRGRFHYAHLDLRIHRSRSGMRETVFLGWS